ncbi:MAG: GGDEF domain-containing protein [Clostridia bacterium]|nr:GGDEF domain-containing protein [Clostridia bacterium]
MNSTERRIIAVCTSWEDVENLNLVLNRLIDATVGTPFLPLCIAFDRNSVEARGETSIREFISAFDLPDLAGYLLFGEMIRSDLINGLLIELAKKKGLPVFMLERQYEGCINMAFQYSTGFEKVARHLIEDHGCRDLVMVAGIKGNSYSEERIHLCRKVLEENGASLPQDQVIYGEYWDEPTIRALNAYFASGGHMPEAFLCANDAMAIAVTIYLSEKNIQVPDQVRVAGFDGILPGEKHEPSITTAMPDFSHMFNLMLDCMRSWDPANAGKTEVWPIPFRFIPRQSCGCTRRSAFRTTQKIGDLKIINLDYTRHIRAMGFFMQRTLSMHSLSKLKECLPPLFAQWPNPFYFAAVLDENDHSLAYPILYGRHGRFESGESFRLKDSVVPDRHALINDSSVRIAMAQLLQNEEETMGYLVSGMKDWSLRDQERFEEEALFLSAALNAVISNRRLKEANDAILKMAEHDYLTGLYNRRGFLRELERRLHLPDTQDQILTLFSMDMDGLKNINDVYGHQEGDHAIQSLAGALQEETEGRGICARYGGDEFAFAFLSDQSFLPALESIRKRMEAKARDICGPRNYLISASLGAYSTPVNQCPSMDEILAESDRALYADKTERKKKRRS